MSSLSSLLPEFLQQLPLTDECREKVVMALWEKAVGETLAQNVRPMRLYKATLVVAVPSETWKRELLALRFEILRRLESVVGKAAVSNLEFRVDPWIEPAPRPAPIPEAEKVSVALQPLESVSDPELNCSLAAVASSYFGRLQSGTR